MRSVPVIIPAKCIFQWALVMDTRFIFSALTGVFCVVMIFATVTTVRHLSNRPELAMSRPQ
jgi:hypothetical protein